jgi:poly(U)-specific endoribonuclease
MDIYQEIWDADQSGSGVKPILDSETGDPAQGYVKVAASANGGPDFKVLTEVVIPESKMRTYRLVTALFDNYALPEPDRENETEVEQREVHELLNAIIDSAPMQVARRYVETSTGTTISIGQWHSILLDLWFKTFSDSGDPELSGFEHVIVGEQQGSVAQGYHFWYKYYLDDGFAYVIDGNTVVGSKSDRIEYVRGKYGNGQDKFPESVTISYKWSAPDYDRNAVRKLSKATGGFFVGCSVEGLMALGAVRAYASARAPKMAVINGALYDLALHRSKDGRSIRTFFPMYKGPAGEIPETPPVVVTNPDPSQPSVVTPPVVASSVRIVAALVNPMGDDPGRETVTLINTGTAEVSLEGWMLLDAMNHRYQVSDQVAKIAAGGTFVIRLPKNSVQLSNKGGEIRLLNREGKVAHQVSYTKKQAQEQGITILF